MVLQSEPVITSVSPSYLPLAGGYLTLSGTNFDAHCGSYSYVQTGTETPAGSVVSCGSTQVIALMPAVNSDTGGMTTTYLAWGGGAYTALITSSSYRTPTITSVTWSGVTALQGGEITIHGTNFGNNQNVYTYASVQSGVAGTPLGMSGDTALIALLPPGQSSGATTYLAWGTVQYIALANSFSYDNTPTITEIRQPPCFHTSTTDTGSFTGTNFGFSWVWFRSIVVTDGGSHVYTYTSGITVTSTQISWTTSGGYGGPTYTLQLNWPNGQLTSSPWYWQDNCF